MKKITKKLSKTLIITLGLAFLLNLVSPVTALAAATAPALGAMSSFSVLADSAMSANGAGVTVSGAMGLSTDTASSRTGTWLPVLGRTEYFGPSSLAKTAQDDATIAKTFMALEPSDGAWGSIAPAPGVWTAAGDPTFDGTLTLTGSATDVWVFNLTSDFTFTGNVVLAGEAQACNVFWQIGRNATINSGGAGTKFVGTLMAGNTVTLGTGVTVNGRIIAGPGGSFTGAGGDIISGPTCAAPSAAIGTGGVTEGTITVVKHVINDNGRTMVVADFPLFINGTKAVSGTTYNYTAPATYTITETSNANYTRTFSGDCNANGQLKLVRGLNEFCIITNNDVGDPVVVPPVPPLIDVVKVPSPLSLPNGPGLVTYTYTLRNIGTVPVTNITMVGDTCRPISLISGDTNNDSQLNLNETWVYTCATTLQATHTNIVTATGWANGLSTTDIASAQVVVGLPIVPPLIHVTKVPSPLALLAGGGIVTYTERITNPGIVALSNVTINDDKCSPMKYVSGDINNDSKLDVTETWTYTCQSRLTKTTTNTAIVSGQANGLTARDIAVATVVVAVAVPVLPSTGFAPGISPLNIALLAACSLLLAISLFAVLKKHHA